MTDSRYAGMNRMEAYEASEDIGRNHSANPTMGDVVAARFGRRNFLKGALAVSAVSALAPSQLLLSGRATADTAAGAAPSFSEIQHGVDQTHHVAPGYNAEILIRWGDKVTDGAPDFDPMQQSAAAQAQQFGYNNDFIGFVPLPLGSNNSDHGLLCVNHEYTNEEVMFPGVGRQDNKAFEGITHNQVDTEMAAHGNTIVEVKKENGKWQVVPDSKYNRRITTSATHMDITGPAAGHDLMKTAADQTGKTAVGTVNNCAGGITPWGTYLTAEENFHGYFGGNLDSSHPNHANFARYGVPGGWYAWNQFYDRFDINQEPNEANRFGYVVEIDPMDPTSRPKKRTALGRFKHEGAETVVNGDGRVVVYMGDDERFDYVYRFVTEGKFDPTDRAANMDLLDKGELSVARFNEDGTVDWLPLVHGQGPLTAENGFADQAEVVIKARLAGDVLGATKMDRPEDVEPNPASGKVYVMLTNNTRRKDGQENVVNPRAPNAFGHIVEMTAPDGDFAAPTHSWDIMVQCGNPAEPEVKAVWNEKTSENGWFAAPDNCAVSPDGQLWVSTDQGSGWVKTGTADGLYWLGTDGETRGMGKMFFRVPVGAELCGPRFTPDQKTLFLAVQHPATDGVSNFPGFEKNSTFEDPATRWPDFQDGMPPRPSIVVITKEDDGVIGS